MECDTLMKFKRILKFDDPIKILNLKAVTYHFKEKEEKSSKFLHKRLLIWTFSCVFMSDGTDCLTDNNQLPNDRIRHRLMHMKEKCQSFFDTCRPFHFLSSQFKSLHLNLYQGNLTAYCSFPLL